MSITKRYAVIGLGYGDEGKGLTTDWLCSKSSHPVVVRFNGGHQAGHTVTIGDMKHTFSNFGSGTLRGVATYWTPYCTVDPVGIYNESKALAKLNVSPKLMISPNCKVTTPYDKAYNQRSKSTLAHGTCGVGFGATIARHEAGYQLVYSDLFNETVLKIKLDIISNYYDLDIDIKSFMECCKFVADTFPIVPSYDAETVIFEGAQGILLDKDVGFFPHVTRSNTGTKNIKVLLSNLREWDSEVELFLVTRAYQTRHGNGPMTNESFRTIINNRNETNSSEHPFQGKFRKSMLDMDLLKYAYERGIDESYKGNPTTLVVTCLDHIEQNWHLTYKGVLVSFQSEDKFVEFISDNLGIEKVIRVRSPKTEDVIGDLDE